MTNSYFQLDHWYASVYETLKKADGSESPYYNILAPKTFDLGSRFELQGKSKKALKEIVEGKLKGIRWDIDDFNIQQNKQGLIYTRYITIPDEDNPDVFYLADETNYTHYERYDVEIFLVENLFHFSKMEGEI